MPSSPSICARSSRPRFFASNATMHQATRFDRAKRSWPREGPAKRERQTAAAITNDLAMGSGNHGIPGTASARRQGLTLVAGLIFVGKLCAVRSILRNDYGKTDSL